MGRSGRRLPPGVPFSAPGENVDCHRGCRVAQAADCGVHHRSQPGHEIGAVVLASVRRGRPLRPAPECGRSRLPDRSGTSCGRCRRSARRGRVVPVPARVREHQEGGSGHRDPASTCGAAARPVALSCRSRSAAVCGGWPARDASGSGLEPALTSCRERTGAAVWSSRRSADDVTMFRGRNTWGSTAGRGPGRTVPSPPLPLSCDPRPGITEDPNESIIRFAPWLLPGCGRGGCRASGGGAATHAGRPE